jgi:hypothetical protein
VCAHGRILFSIFMSVLKMLLVMTTTFSVTSCEATRKFEHFGEEMVWKATVSQKQRNQVRRGHNTQFGPSVGTVWNDGYNCRCMPCALSLGNDVS